MCSRPQSGSLAPFPKAGDPAPRGQGEGVLGRSSLHLQKIDFYGDASWFFLKEGGSEAKCVWEPLIYLSRLCDFLS